MGQEEPKNVMGKKEKRKCALDVGTETTLQKMRNAQHVDKHAESAMEKTTTPKCASLKLARGQ